MIYHHGGEPERAMHCWRNVMAHKPWITAEFVTVCCSMSMVSKTVMSWFSHTYECRLCMDLPYSGKLSREKTFANFAFLWLYAKVFSAKFGVWRHLALQKWAIHKSFLRENRIFTNSRKFSPSKVYGTWSELNYYAWFTLSVSSLLLSVMVRSCRACVNFSCLRSLGFLYTDAVLWQ